MIVLTGYGQEEDRRRTWAAGFHHDLTEPVDPAALCRALETPASAMYIVPVPSTSTPVG